MTYQADTQSSEKKITIDQLPHLTIGADTIVPTLHGPRRYINFDNAASTPTFAPVADAVNDFLQWYSNVHRGTGFKSQLASWAFERSRDMVAEFVGADLTKQVVLFTKNTTEAINKMARRSGLTKDDVVLTTLMEHHSNELPWRRVATVKHVRLNEDGTISKEHFVEQLKEHGSKVKLVAITGASNVSGYINDLDFFATGTHRAGAKILVDGAQLVPHRPVSMRTDHPERMLDYLVFSAHKMYAPFGVGVLVGDRATFELGDPEMVGGGMVDIVTLEEAYWSDLPEKEEAGTPDIVGVVALARAIKLFHALGFDAIVHHEAELTAYALRKLNEIPEVQVYGDTNPDTAEQRLGVISFNINGVSHALVSAVLSYEGAIGVRSGCFCAHTYVKSLLHVSDDESALLERQILARDRSQIPGAVRASFGLYNTTAEIDELVTMVKKIVAGDYSDQYVMDKEKGEFRPKNYHVDFEKYFKF